MQAEVRHQGLRRRRRAVQRAGLGVTLIVGALLMAAAIESPAVAWLGWFGLVPLFFVIRMCPPPSAILGGAVWGISVFIFSSAQPAPGINPATHSLALLAVIPAIYAGLGAAITRWVGFNPIILGVAWMGVELALGPLGLKGGVLGTAPAHGTVMEWVGSAFGYTLVAFLVASVNAAVVSALSALRLTIPGHRDIARSRKGEGQLVPQTLFSSLISAVGPRQPRAPPIQLAILQRVTRWGILSNGNWSCMHRQHRAV